MFIPCMPFRHICPEAVRPWVLVSPVPAWQLYAYGTFSDIQKGRFCNLQHTDIQQHKPGVMIGSPSCLGRWEMGSGCHSPAVRLQPPLPPHMQPMGYIWQHAVLGLRQQARAQPERLQLLLTYSRARFKRLDFFLQVPTIGLNCFASGHLVGKLSPPPPPHPYFLLSSSCSK